MSLHRLLRRSKATASVELVDASLLNPAGRARFGSGVGDALDNATLDGASDGPTKASGAFVGEFVNFGNAGHGAGNRVFIVQATEATFLGFGFDTR